MHALITIIQAHWVQILAVLGTSYTAIVELFSRISAALPAPTAQSTPRYIFWFQFANNLARNPERAKNSRGSKTLRISSRRPKRT